MVVEAVVAGVVGVMAGVIGTIAAIPERPGARRPPGALPDEARRIAAAFPAAAVLVRTDGRVAYANPLASALGVVGTGGALAPTVLAMVEDLRSTGESQERDAVVRRGVASKASTISVQALPLGDDFALVLGHDHVEQQSAEALRREFAVNVSHELKTPVGALVLLAEALAAEADEPETVRELAARIGRESSRVAKLIQDIIEISRLQGAVGLEAPEEVDLAAVAREAVDTVTVAAGKRGIQVVVNAAEPLLCVGERPLLGMAVRNLVENAIAYSDEGGRVTVDVRVKPGVAELAVVDQGIGIAAADQERIFERFFRTDPARSRATGGTGLGLSIVKHVATLHGGEVEVWSRPGVGSTFTLRLPARAKEGR